MFLSDREGNKSMVRHEFGHYISAKSLGFIVTEVSLNEKTAHCAIDLIPVIGDIKSLRLYLEKRIQVLLSGSCAEAFDNTNFNGEKYCKLLDTTAKNDFSKMSEILRVLAGTYIDSEASVDQFEKKMYDIKKQI